MVSNQGFESDMPSTSIGEGIKFLNVYRTGCSCVGLMSIRPCQPLLSSDDTNISVAPSGLSIEEQKPDYQQGWLRPAELLHVRVQHHS